MRDKIKKKLKKVIIDTVAIKELLFTAYETYQQERKRRFGKKKK
tara:strand:+ start:658 stop:789 length:132 start_codon:yes stop_codon:yes gene_type:complete